MLDLKELFGCLAPPYKVKEAIVTGNNLKTFKCRLVFEGKELKELIGDCQWMVKEMPESYYIHLWPYADPLKSLYISHQAFSSLNRKLKLGHLKKLKDSSNIQTTCIFHTIRYDIVRNDSIKDLITKAVRILANELLKSIVDLKHTENSCSNCELKFRYCECDEMLETNEKTIFLCEDFKKYIKSDLFDFSEEFYDEKLSRYFFNPGDLLENKLRTSKLSEDFNLSLDEFIMKLDCEGLYLKKYPMNLLMYYENKSKNQLFLAPALENKELFDKYFSVEPTDFDLKHEIIRRINSNIPQKPAVHDFLPLDNFKNSENLKLFRSYGDKFYSLCRTELIDGTKVIIKVPNSDDIARVEKEYLASLEFQHSKQLVTPLKLVKIGHKIGIACYDYQGQLLQDLFKKMDNVTKIKVMKDVAEFLQMIHAKNIFHLNINPKTIVVKLKGRAKVLNMKYATKTPRISQVSESSLIYSDPDMLVSRYAGFYSDVWSWAVTFISLFTNLEPYSGVLSPDFFKPTDPSGSNHFSNVSQDIYTEVITKGKLPLIENLGLPSEIASLLKNCLVSPGDNRPVMANIIKILGNSLI